LPDLPPQPVALMTTVKGAAIDRRQRWPVRAGRLGLAARRRD